MDYATTSAHLHQAYAAARVKAVQILSKALAHAAGGSIQRAPRPRKLDLAGRKQQTEPATASRSKALAVMKVAVKHKPKLIKFTGAVTVPVEAERVAPPLDAPPPPPGWALVCYRDGPAPVGKPMKHQLKTYRTSGRRRPMAGLSSAYKRPVQAELVPGAQELEEEDAVSEADVERMEAWLQHARESMEARQQQQQQQQQQAANGVLPAAEPSSQMSLDT